MFSDSITVLQCIAVPNAKLRAGALGDGIEHPQAPRRGIGRTGEILSILIIAELLMY
jgi:hypothetical protein